MKRESFCSPSPSKHEVQIFANQAKSIEGTSTNEFCTCISTHVHRQCRVDCVKPNSICSFAIHSTVLHEFFTWLNCYFPITATDLDQINCTTEIEIQWREVARKEKLGAIDIRTLQSSLTFRIQLKYRHVPAIVNAPQRFDTWKKRFSTSNSSSTYSTIETANFHFFYVRKIEV